MIRAGLQVCAATAGLAALLSAPAAASGPEVASGPGTAAPAAPVTASPEPPPADARYYRSTVTGIDPPVPGLVVTAAPGSFTLVNHTGYVVTVLGYAGEPYLRVSAPRGVERNVTSLTAAVNAARPAGPGHRAPDWQPLADGSTAIWRDDRTNWTRARRPPAVAADPHHARTVADWALRLTVGSRPVVVHGTLRWTGAPRFSSNQVLVWSSTVALIALAALGFLKKYSNPQARATGTPVSTD